jgi:hypothetical protein
LQETQHNFSVFPKWLWLANFFDKKLDMLLEKNPDLGIIKFNLDKNNYDNLVKK